jgi:hypothetical protein
MVCGLRPRTVLALGALGLGLPAAGLRTSAAGVFWAFTGCWALLSAAAFAVICGCADDDRTGR